MKCFWMKRCLHHSCSRAGIQFAWLQDASGTSSQTLNDNDGRTLVLPPMAHNTGEYAKHLLRIMKS